MQRWQLTLGLTGIALAAAIIAPRLSGMVTPQPVQMPPSPVPTPVTPIAEVPVPTSTGHLELTAGLDKLALLKGASQERFLVVNIDAPDDIGRTFRRPVDMAVVIDASGSMSARGKIDYAKRAAKLIASEMDPGDTFSLITFNDEATTVIGATSVSDPRSIHRQIDRIYEGGGTNLYEGLSRGAREVERTLHDEAVGRVVILSDGHANVGVTDTDSLSRYAATIAGKGVSVSTIGLGLDYNEDLLANMADLSGGTYDFVDDPRDLESVFADELDRTASVIAADTQVTIQLPDGVTPIEVIGWDAKPNGNGWTVPIGNVYSGDTRKVIARVRVDSAFSQGRAHVEPDIEVASVRLDYQDVVDDITASAHASAAAQLTDNAMTAETRVDRERAIEANRAYGSWFLNESAHAYKNGEVQKSRDLLQAGSSILKSASSQLSAPELANEADDLDQQELLYDSYAPASDEGKRAIKSGKERFRGRAR